MKSKELSKSKTVLLLIGLMLSLLLSALDSTIVSTAMKMIVNDLQGMESYAWPFTIYMLCSTIIIPISGGIADIYGRKPVFLSGIFLFLTGSVLCAASKSMLLLILFRGIQGIGGGILITSVFTVIADMFSPQKRGKYMGIVSSMFGLASIIGPLLGGLITDHLSWRWIFLINIPLGILALAAIIAFMPNYKSSQQKKPIDIPGTISLTAALVPMLLAFRFAGTDFSWISFPIISMFTFSVIMLIIFVYFEAKSPNPIMPLSFFKQQSISVSFVVAFLTNSIMFAAIMYIPYFVQGIIGTNATTSGAITTPMMLGLMITSNLAGIIASRHISKKILVIIAFTLTAIGTGLLSTMSCDISYYKVIIYMVILGFGIGINMPITNINVQNSVPLRQISSATSTVQFFRNIGSTVGSAIFGTVMINKMNLGFSGLNVTSIPANVQDLLKNPQIITNAESVNQMLNKVPSQYLNSFQNLLNQARDALAVSIRLIFLLCMVLSLLSILISLFFKDAPSNSQEAVPFEQPEQI